MNDKKNRKDKAEKVKKEVEKKKSSITTLQSLNGKTPEDMTKAERKLYDRAIGQLLGVLNASGKVEVA